MAAIRTTTKMIIRDIIRPSLFFEPVRMFRTSLPSLGASIRLKCRGSATALSGARLRTPETAAQRSRRRGYLRFSNSWRKRRRELLLPATNLSPKSH
ncbi:hypothetical protein U1Q18_051248 [Sarracenia purpurea var. burkii]